MKYPLGINSISSIASQFETFIIDQWGVIHDGKKGFKFAFKCIEKLYKLNKNLIIISNSSQMKAITTQRLIDLGFDVNFFNSVNTSGEMIYNQIKKPTLDWSRKLGENCFHLFNPSTNNKFIKNLNKNFVDNIHNANFILGSTVDPKFKTLDYVPLLRIGVNKKLPFVCANPDYESVEAFENGSKAICMGTIAKLYESLGGKMYFLGKPSSHIYNESIYKIKNFKKSLTVAIGDSIHHDILGAKKFGIKSLLITSGIHKKRFFDLSPTWNEHADKYFGSSVRPDFICEKFIY
ncbi:MAG: hypothetical protein CFH21_00822 [Alphaproteobacteria bacterium MarineAlpha5_Bin11]|nr:TIGR01459 family HAD-type hydrolase [Pelagibacteraceae bacterium]PPR43352.1 MAG: hypothetical protein CFH21_00822 [Alphaproteobacteria bacterium MarineAlpha5_Bin11]PPR52032.1 MAG: hypothetical protein CFH20_00220 [Alphaproteobacteria bacterium MarineAlpha5_Bin10]